MDVLRCHGVAWCPGVREYRWKCSRSSIHLRASVTIPTDVRPPLIKVGTWTPAHRIAGLVLRTSNANI